jgi:hypothetical protein
MTVHIETCICNWHFRLKLNSEFTPFGASLLIINHSSYFGQRVWLARLAHRRPVAGPVGVVHIDAVRG